MTTINRLQGYAFAKKKGDKIYLFEGPYTPDQTHVEPRLMTPAGDRYGEALALECAYQRWRMDKLEAALIEKGVKL